LDNQTFYSINGSAKEEVRKKSVEVARRLELTLYDVRLNHKHIVMITSWLDTFDGTERSKDQQELLELLKKSEVAK